MSYASETDLKVYLNISTSSDDWLLGYLLTAATKAIDTYTHRTFAATSTTKYFDETFVDGDVLTLNEDLYSVTTITNGESNTITSYWLLPRNQGPPYYQVKLKDASDYSWSFDSDGEISILGYWGYSLTPAADIEQACLRLAGYYYRQKDAQVFDVTAQPDMGLITIPKGIPADVKLLLDPYRRLGLA